MACIDKHHLRLFCWHCWGYHWNPTLTWDDSKILGKRWHHGGHSIHGSTTTINQIQHVPHNAVCQPFFPSLILYDPVLVERVAWWDKGSVGLAICMPGALIRTTEWRMSWKWNKVINLAWYGSCWHVSLSERSQSCSLNKILKLSLPPSFCCGRRGKGVVSDVSS